MTRLWTEVFPELFRRNEPFEFKPAHIAFVSGVNPDKQRQWRHRGVVPYVSQRITTDNDAVVHGLQWKIANFLVEGHGFDVIRAANFAVGCARKRGLVSPLDYSHRTLDAPLFAVCYPGPSPESYQNVTTTGATIGAPLILHPTFGFFVNLSELVNTFEAELASLVASGAFD